MTFLHHVRYGQYAFDFVEAKTRACQEIVDHLGCGDALELLQYFRRPGCGFEDWTIYGTIFWTWVYSHDLRMMNAVRYTKQRN
jgi:hypothetical protein